METNKNPSGRLLLTACIISFVCFFGSYMRIPIVPLFATSLGADTVQVGMVIRGEGFRGGFFLSGAVVVIVLLLFRFLYRRQPALEPL